MGLGAGEFGRIEHDQVELRTAFGQAAQRGEGVGIAPFGTRRVEAVERDVALGGGERLAGRIDRDHAGGAALECCQRKTTGIAKAVQHGPVRSVPLDQQAAVALVDVEAGLVSEANVDVIEHARFVDYQAVRRFVARQHAGDRG